MSRVAWSAARRPRARGLAAAALFALGVPAQAQLDLYEPPRGAELYGQTRAVCKAHELRFLTIPSVSVPTGKREWVRVHIRGGTVSYVCGGRQRWLSCPAGSKFLRVQRAPYGGILRIKCYGPSKSPFVPSTPEEGDAPPGEGAPESEAPAGAERPSLAPE